MGRYELLACPQCGYGKDYTVRSYGMYKVFFNGSVVKLKCRTCHHIQRFKIIGGGI